MALKRGGVTARTVGSAFRHLSAVGTTAGTGGRNQVSPRRGFRQVPARLAVRRAHRGGDASGWYGSGCRQAPGRGL